MINKLMILIVLNFVLLEANDYSEGMKAYSVENYKKAYTYFLKASKKGNKDAYFQLSIFYRKGKVVPKDIDKSIFFLEKAAEKGHKKAQYNLGNFYREGKVVQQDYRKALEYYNLSADQNFTWAQFNLGRMYIEGMGTKRDYKKAFKLFKLLSDKNISNAQYRLANMYYYGYGTKKDFSKAINLWEKAVEKGCNKAIDSLSFFHKNHPNYYQKEEEILRSINRLKYLDYENNKTLNYSEQKDFKKVLSQYFELKSLFPSSLFLDTMNFKEIDISVWSKFIDISIVNLKYENREKLSKEIYTKHLLNAKFLMKKSSTMQDYMISLDAYQKLSKYLNTFHINKDDIIWKQYLPVGKKIFFTKLQKEKVNLLKQVEILGKAFLKKKNISSKETDEAIKKITKSAKDYSDKYFIKIEKAIRNNSLAEIENIEILLEKDKKNFLKSKEDVNLLVGKLFTILLVKPLSYYKSYDVHNQIIQLYKKYTLDNFRNDSNITVLPHHLYDFPITLDK